MTDLETRLRHELEREAERVRPEFLRPLQPPGSRSAEPHRFARRPATRAAAARRWLAPVAAMAAVAALLSLAVAGRSTSEGASSLNELGGEVIAPPRFYVAITGQPPAEQAVVHEAPAGQVVSSARIPAGDIGRSHFQLQIAAASDDRNFAIVAQQGIGHAHPALFVLFLRVGPDGRSARLIPAVRSFRTPAPAALLEGVAMSADGTRLAATLATSPPGPATRGYIEMMSLKTGRTRSWTATDGIAADPAWVDGGRYLGFLWAAHLARSVPRYAGAASQVRLLDTAAAGHSLLGSRVLASGGPLGFISSALLSPDGRTITATTFRNVPGHRGRGSAVVRLVSLSAATGRMTGQIRKRVVRYRGAQQLTAADFSCQVLSLAQAGQALVQCPRLAALAGGRLAGLPGVAQPPAVAW
jgi:hypothetical protein